MSVRKAEESWRRFAKYRGLLGAAHANVIRFESCDEVLIVTVKKMPKESERVKLANVILTIWKAVGGKLSNVDIQTEEFP